MFMQKPIQGHEKKPTKAGASKGCTIPENIGIVVKCGYAVFSCHSASGRSTAPMQL